MMMSVDPRNSSTGQRTASIDVMGERTEYEYDSLGRTVTTTRFTEGRPLETVSVYDEHSQLISEQRIPLISSSIAGLSATRYVYDDESHLRMVETDDGARSYFFYNELDQEIARVDAMGSVIESVYDRRGFLVETIEYATIIDTRSWFDGQQVVVNDFSTVRPLPNTANDRHTLSQYDEAGRWFAIANASVSAFSVWPAISPPLASSVSTSSAR